MPGFAQVWQLPNVTLSNKSKNGPTLPNTHVYYTSDSYEPELLKKTYSLGLYRFDYLKEIFLWIRFVVFHQVDQ